VILVNERLQLAQPARYLSALLIKEVSHVGSL
jgi:hypothetical protein